MNKIMILARCGNYYPCSTNPCQNDGQCIAMYPSPNLEAYEAPVVSRYRFDSEDWNNTEAGNIFLMSPTFSKWEDAANYCIAKDTTERCRITYISIHIKKFDIIIFTHT